MLTNSSNYSGLGDVAVFVCVVQTGSFTAAAEKLNISKSVVSKYVTRLEDRLGAQLLTRTTRRLSLTEMGQVFFERSQQGLEAIGDAEEAVSVLQGEPRGTLKVNAPMSFGVMHIAPAIPEFKERYPNVSVDMSCDDRKVDVIEEGFDVSVRITGQLDGTLVARRIGPCRHALVASPAYVEQYGEPKTPKELVDHNVITYQFQQSPWEWEFKAANSPPITVPVTGDVQMNNSLAIREAVLAGVGITRTPTFVVGEDIKAGRLVTLLPQYELLEVSIYVMFPQRQYLAPKVRAFVDFMAERFEGTPEWDRFN